MRSIASAIILLLVSISARAEQELVPFTRLPQATRAKIEAAHEASFHFRLDAGVDCTGTYVSNTGHFVTALHCVAGCLAKNHAIAKERAHDEPTAKVAVGQNPLSGVLQVKSLYTNKMTILEDRIDAGLVCPGTLGTKGAKAQMRVIMTGGKGWLAPKETLAGFSRKFPEEYRALVDGGYEHGADFAILQVEDTKKSPCLPLAKAAPAENQSLHAIPYACVTRDSGLEASGQTALYTRGRRTQGFKQSDYYRLYANKQLPFDAESVNRSETFFSTLDMEKCGSGTGVFDDSLSLVGIATRVYKSSTRYERGSLEAINVAQIWRELMDKKSGSDIKEITGCARPSPLKAWERLPATPKLRVALPPARS